MLGLILWALIFIVIAACMLPWWFFLAVIVASIAYEWLFGSKF